LLLGFLGMSKKAKDEEQQMLPLNVDLPPETIDLIKLAKVLTRQPIRAIVKEAIDDWLKKRGLSADKLPKLKEPK
jgi:hypothetical protein